MRAFLAPRPVRFYPARGVRYESQLAPPPHLVGLRIAALDSLLEEPTGGAEPPVVVASAVALMERVPDPNLRPHGFSLERGSEIDLDEILERLVACGYERFEQVEDRGQFAARGGILDIYPATSERAARVELFGDEIESLRWFSTFTQRSLADAERVEIAPASELDPSYRELASLAASSWLAVLHPAHTYGEHHLTDLVLATRFANADVVGNASFETTDGSGAIDRSLEHRFVESVHPHSVLVKRNLIESRGWPDDASGEPLDGWFRQGVRIYSSDAGNFIADAALGLPERTASTSQ
jgi:transcription-repair coupling factor (superfamily II helicase)